MVPVDEDETGGEPVRDWLKGLPTEVYIAAGGIIGWATGILLAMWWLSR